MPKYCLYVAWFVDHSNLGVTEAFNGLSTFYCKSNCILTLDLCRKQSLGKTQT